MACIHLIAFFLLMLILVVFLSLSVAVFRVQIPECRLRKAFVTRELSEKNKINKKQPPRALMILLFLFLVL